MGHRKLQMDSQNKNTSGIGKKGFGKMLVLNLTYLKWAVFDACAKYSSCTISHLMTSSVLISDVKAIITI